MLLDTTRRFGKHGAYWAVQDDKGLTIYAQETPLEDWEHDLINNGYTCIHLAKHSEYYILGLGACCCKVRLRA